MALNKKINPLDFQSNIAIGIGLPFNSDVGGFKLNYVTEDQIHDNLKNLLLTMKGERLMHPTFGSNIYNLMFEPGIEEDIQVKALNTIQDTVSEWMNFVTIKDVKVTMNDNTLNILVSYEVKELDIAKILDLTVKV